MSVFLRILVGLTLIAGTSAAGLNSGYPQWQDYVPEERDQTLVTAKMSSFSYDSSLNISSNVVNDRNRIVTLGTTFFFSTNGTALPWSGTARVAINVPANTSFDDLSTSDRASFPPGATQGYYQGPPNPTPYSDDHPLNVGIAFHCIYDSRHSSNEFLDDLQFHIYQALFPVVDADGIITGYHLMEDADGLYNNYLFVFRGSKVIQDYFTEISPPEYLLEDIRKAVPTSLLARYQPYYSNVATKVAKRVTVWQNLAYEISGFLDGTYDLTKVPALNLSTMTFTGHSYGGAVSSMFAEYLARTFIPRDPVNFQPTVYIETYNFGAPPFQYDTAPMMNRTLVDRDGNPLRYAEDNRTVQISDFVYIRNFINHEDAVPSINIPNYSGQPVNYVHPTQPAEIYHLYRLNGVTSDLEIISAYTKEPAPTALFLPMGSEKGIPVYLAFNNDHSTGSYLAGIARISPDRFNGIVNGSRPGVNYGVNAPAYQMTRARALLRLQETFLEGVQSVLELNVPPPGYFYGTNIKIPQVTPDTFLNLLNSLR